MMQLIDGYQPLVRWVCQFAQPEIMALDYVTFRQRTEQYFVHALNASIESGHSEEEAHSAQFAMVVWFDEVVLRSALPFKHQWRNSLLQTYWYQTVIGGEEFFSRLDALREDQQAVRMIYLYCLLMGFHGQYHYQDSNQLVERIRFERQYLPAKWKEWPNDAEISPISHYFVDDMSEGVSRHLKSKYTLIIIPGICYALSSLLLSLVE